MSLSKEDLDGIRAIVVQELDARDSRIGPILADWCGAEVEKLRPAMVDGLKIVAVELDKIRKGAAEESREISRALGRIEGKIGPLGMRVGGVETRLAALETGVEVVKDLLGKVYSAQGIDLQQGATIRESLMPGEKAAVTETQPAFDGELESAAKTDASPPATEAE